MQMSLEVMFTFGFQGSHFDKYLCFQVQTIKLSLGKVVYDLNHFLHIVTIHIFSKWHFFVMLIIW